ncbi:MAG TPA: hypothetical protein VFT29_03250 [Gemmatimonadaceae bacterium]|nr:hypothetical protein [Gemmatimonadaceae bacterium]
MNARLGMLVFAVAVCALAPARLQAQQATPSKQSTTPTRSISPTPTANAMAAGPRLELTATAVRRPAVADSTGGSALIARRQNMGRPVALMIVGGSAFLVGAVIGGDAGTIFMIGGAVTGLIGLYQYLQ